MWALELGFVNAFLVAGDDGLVLIDTGCPVHLDTIRAGVADLGPLKHIALTHYHPDHVGSLAGLVTADLTVYAHPVDAPGIRGDAPVPVPEVPEDFRDYMARVRAEARLDEVAPARVDVEVADGDEAAGMRVIHTPGHTMGHVVFLDERRSVLFAGDAAANFGALTVGGIVDEDAGEAQRSFRRMAELDFEIAVFGHGTVLRERAAAAFRRLIEAAG